MAGYKHKHTKRPLAKRASHKLTTRSKAVKTAKKISAPLRKTRRLSKARPAVHLDVLRTLPEKVQLNNEENSEKKMRNLINAYQKKRNFLRTPEPAGGNYEENSRPIFVVQKHNASRLHYDFRIEVNGVLKSWAVPKGVSSTLHDKRLAVATEDHPLEYANFEGAIPTGEYGAGTVIIWDWGYYENVTPDRSGNRIESIEKSLKAGHLQIRLQGKKIKGNYLLQRFSQGKKTSWLLIKVK